ncbi:LemA family protein [Algibacter lectus]|nr:LemA family protein [Algibacter lectus]
MHIKTFPNSILAGLFNFEPLNYFKAEAGSEKAPDVDFEF